MLKNKCWYDVLKAMHFLVVFTIERSIIMIEVFTLFIGEMVYDLLLVRII